MKKALAGIAAGLTLTGGGVIVDEAINPYTDQGNVFEIAATSAIADAGQIKVALEKNRPAISLTKWDGAAELTVIPIGNYGRGSRALFTDRMEWKAAEEEVHAYPLPPTAQIEDGGFEIEIFLKERPARNVFEFAIEGADEFDFFYQGELTAAEIKRGDIRPENVTGSYAVYHKERRNHIEGQPNYGTGKAFHIFRPRAFDASGRSTWATLKYDAETAILTVDVPGGWLETATYPVRVDPTIGYTTLGGTDIAITGNCCDFGVATKAVAFSGTITAISQYLKKSGSTSDNFVSQISNDSSGLPDNSGAPYTSADASIASTSYTLQTVNLSQVFATNTYWVTTRGIEQQGFDDSYIAADSGGVSGDTAVVATDFGAWAVSSMRYSQYATYSVTVASSIESDLIHFE